MATVAEQARRLGVPRKVLDSAIKRGSPRLKAHRIGRYIMVFDIDLATWLAATEIKP